MFQNTVTVFNYHEKTGLWYMSVIPGADLIALKSSNHSTEGTNSADTVDILINCSAEKVFSTLAGEKGYLPPKEYKKCGDPANNITFTPERDFIYAGEWQDLTPVDDDEYDEGFYHALNEEYDGIYMISSAAFYGLLPHFEIGGR